MLDIFRIYNGYRSWSIQQWIPFRRSVNRPRIRRNMLRSTSAELPPSIIWAGFIVAGVFLPYVADTQGNVLLRADPEACDFQRFSLNATRAARDYARLCYANCLHSVNSAACSFYTVSKLGSASQSLYNACPFGDPDMDFYRRPCSAPKSSESFLVFTSMLNSNDDLGINAPDSDQVVFQKNVTCSILSIEGRQHRGLNTQPDSIYATYPEHNWTFVYNVQTPSDIVPYQVNALRSRAGEVDGPWQPDRPFKRPDADTSLVLFTPNSVVYEHRVDDPLYLAEYVHHAPMGTLSPKPFYQPNNILNMVGCIDQYRICNPIKSPDLCSVPSGYHAIRGAIDQLDFNDHQYATAERIRRILDLTDTYSSVAGSGFDSLRASDQVEGIISPGLPSNQWKLEIEGWFQTSLAKMQALAVEYARNQPRSQEYPKPDFGTGREDVRQILARQCSGQKVSNPGGYLTFRLYWLMIILGVGILLFVLNCARDPIAAGLASLWSRSVSSSDLRTLSKVYDKFELFAHAGLADLDRVSGSIPGNAQRLTYIASPVASVPSAAPSPSPAVIASTATGTPPSLSASPTDKQSRGLARTEPSSRRRRLSCEQHPDLDARFCPCAPGSAWRHVK